MNNCEHAHHHDMEFNQCIHMHKVEPIKVELIKCGTDENCDIHMVAAGESFATAGSSVWTLVKKIGCLIEKMKATISEAITTAYNGIIESIGVLSDKVDEHAEAISTKIDETKEAVSNINITVDSTASAVAESDENAQKRHEAVMDKLNNLDTYVELTDDDVDSAYEESGK